MIQKRIYNYFERNPQLRVLFVFDKMGGFEAELQDASWGDEYIYHTFDGKWFNLKLHINRDWNAKKVVLLFPWELRPDTEEKRLNFPLLDVLETNMEFKDEGYAEFMQRYGLPPTHSIFIKNHIDELSSTKLTTMLSGSLNAESFNTDLGARALLSSYLGDKKPLDWDTIIIKMIILGLKSESKKNLDFYTRLHKPQNRDLQKTIDEKLNGIFGMSYDPNTEEKMGEIACSLKYNAIAQSLSTVPGDDYKHLKIQSRLALDQINRIFDKGQTEAAYSVKFKEALRELASSIKESELIKLYGVDAPYFYITEELASPIVNDIIKNGVDSDSETVLDRMRSLSLRLGADSRMMPLIKFIESAALMFDAIARIETYKLDTPKEYVTLYTDSFVNVDRNYQVAVEEYYGLPVLNLELSETVRQFKKYVDSKYTEVCNLLNIEWLDCIKETGSDFKKVEFPRQNNFFSDVFDPTKRWVVIISDALRYDTAAELVEKLGKEKHTISIAPMLSLLPSETKFCKPALFPHQGLELKGDKMEVDGKVLSTTGSRTDQLQKYRNDAICVNFKDVSSQIQSHRELFKRQLVYVLHDRIDNNSHGQTAEDVVNNCRKAIEELTKFVYSLHMTLNCYNVIITSDHGFIFNDLKFEDKDKISIKEDAIESSSRYYLTHNADNIEGVVKFNMADSEEIETSEPTYIATPSGTNRFGAPGGYVFTHGGASLQEMLVPVIMSNRRETQSKQKVNVMLKTSNLSLVSSQLRFQIIQKEAVSLDVVSRTVTCRLYEGDRQVADEVLVTLDSTDANNISKRTYDVCLRLSESVSGGLLQLRIYDVDDTINPLIKETVKNNTIIEQDF